MGWASRRNPKRRIYRGGVIMSLIDWFGIGYIVVSIIVIIVYLGVYFGWF